MALESSPFSRTTPEQGSGERKDLPRAEKPEALEVYGLAAAASSGTETIAALNAFTDGWEQYAKDRNYFEKGDGALNALRAKQAEAKSTALKMRNAYLEYTAAKSKEKVTPSILPSDRFKGLNTMQELEEKKAQEAAGTPSAAWEGYQEQLKELEATLKEQLKEMGPLAQKVEEAVAENEAYIYKREKSPEELRREMGKSVRELEYMAADEEINPLKANRQRFEEVIKPAIEQKTEERAKALDGKSKGLFSKVRGWFGGSEDKPKSGIRRKVAFWGALGALMGIGVGVSTYDNAPRRTEKVTRVQQSTASPEARGAAAPPMPEPLSMTESQEEPEAVAPALKKRWTTTRTSIPETAEAPVAASTAEYVSPIKNVIPLPEGMDPNSPEATAFLNKAYNPEVFAKEPQA